MLSEERKRLVAPCGIDCGNCELYLSKDNIQIHQYLISKGIPEEKIPCGGCRNIEGACPVIGGICATYTCVHDKKVNYCFECSGFPCDYLNPAADRAETLPHNTKVFNLCKIERSGLEEFIAHSADIKQKYYRGKMQVGKGPQLPL